MRDAATPVLAIEGLRVTSSSGEILRGVDLVVPRAEVVGVVGESGSGKTTLGLAVMGLLGRTRSITAGRLSIGGVLIGGPGLDRTGTLRGHRLSLIPQDPFRAFDPLRRMGPQVRRPLELHRGLAAGEAEARAADLLTRLGVADPRGLLGRYPHQLSGGMLQRAAIATALVCGPELVVADEPTSALDVLVQLQVIDSFLGIVRELGTSVLLITHDLRLLERMADRVAAMYAGRIVEFGAVGDLLTAPRHHYPAALVASSVLAPEPGRPLPAIEGQPPALPGIFAPCAFAPRCPRADGVCWTEEPWYAWPAEAGYACHHPRTEPVVPRLEGAA